MKTTTIVKTLTAAMMVASLAGCSSAPAAPAESTGGEAKTLLVAISPDYPPYDSLTASGEVEGYDVDMAEWLFDWFKENGYNYDLEWKQMSFDTICAAIQADQVDLGISGFTYDEDRKVLFSDPYYISAQVAIVAADSDIATVDDLVGKKIGAQMGSTGEGCANEIEGAVVTAIEDMGVCVEPLKAGGFDAVIMDSAVAKNYAATGSYKLLDGVLQDEENMIIANEANTELMTAVNAAIAAYKASSAAEEIEQKWMAE